MGFPVTVLWPETIQWLLVRNRGTAAHFTLAGTYGAGILTWRRIARYSGPGSSVM